MGAVWGGVGGALSPAGEWLALGTIGFLLWLAMHWEEFQNTAIPFPQFIS